MLKIFFRIAVFLYAASLFFLAKTSIASESIRVAVADNQTNVVLKSSSGFFTEGGNSQPGGKRLVFSASTMGRAPVRVKSVDDFTLVNGKRYRGTIELRKKGNGLLLVINDLDLEEYLRGVVAAEVPPDWGYEALKAQAVASRTYALYQKRAAGRRHFHILSTIDSQVYNGVIGEASQAVRAVRETKGLVLTYRGEVIAAFYHSSCGGHTENAAELWGIDEPYLQGVDCDCQEISKYGLWEKRASLTKIAQALRRQGYRLHEISDMRIKSITPAGHVRSIEISSSSGTVSVPAETLRAALGNTEVPSVFFELGVEAGEAVFSGRGSGHGVGLCQWGAEEMALRGSDFRAILSHYYPGTSLTRIY